MRTDADIRRDVESELQWDPSIDDKRVGVAVNNGVVTLTGDVAHYSGRWAAEDIAKRVLGVRAIANDIQIQIPASGVRTDTQIAEAAANALRWLGVADREGELGLSEIPGRKRRATSHRREGGLQRDWRQVHRQGLRCPA
jgi:hypothetical protein